MHKLSPDRRADSWRASALKRAILYGAIAALPCSVVAQPAQVQEAYPARPVRVLVGFPAGGTNDVIARLVTQSIAQQTGWRFVVENRPGAGSNIAMEALASAAPDGYTVLINTPGVVINPSLYGTVRYKWDSFEPIGMIGEAPLVLLANPKVPVRDNAQLQSYAKGLSEPLKFASSGNGSSSHLAMDLLRAVSGLTYLHVPYRGGGQAMTDTIAGQTELTMQPITNSLESIASGRLRPIAQTGKTRAGILPDVPTFAESGLPNYSMSTWYVALAPANTPKPIVTKLHAAMDQALRSADLRAKLEHAGVQVVHGDERQAADFMRQEHAKWSSLIATTGTKVD